jgi:hypothetical protein
VLEDFVETQGGSVARTVRNFMPFTPGQARCKVTIWHADDLGERSAKHDDFIIRVREGTRIHCVKPKSRPKPVDGMQAFDITRFTAEDLLPDCLRGKTIPQASSRHWLIRLIGILVAIAIVGFWVCCWHRRRQASRMP